MKNEHVFIRRKRNSKTEKIYNKEQLELAEDVEEDIEEKLEN